MPVNARISVQQGPQFIVHSVREQFFYQGASTPEEERTIFPNHACSRLWLQDLTLSLKTNLYHRGYPDARVDIRILQQQTNGHRVKVELLASATSGPQVRIDSIESSGQRKTRQWLLARRVKVKRGEWLDPIRVEEGRYRLAWLGIFDRVDLDYPAVDEPVRAVFYRLKEGKQLNLSLLFGYGSYELLRGGLELKHDRRDNPLYPRRGYKAFLTVETARANLGGDAMYHPCRTRSGKCSSGKE
jgi:outer membrane protein insertion porin family